MKMLFEILENYDMMSQKAAQIVADFVVKNPKCVLGLPTGQTPVGLYDRLGMLCAEAKADFHEVKTFNLDEYYPIAPEHPQSYRRFMNEHLFSKINIPMDATHVPCGTGDAEENCRQYEEAIRLSGGIDLQILGIGRNGHIGFNEPNGDENAPTHQVTLTESTIDANARFFADKNDVPKYAVTMGIATIMRAKQILLLISGKEKYQALHALLGAQVRGDCPATVLLRHADVTVLCDRAAFEGK